jgi:GT2 family glycosyltransferase
MFETLIPQLDPYGSTGNIERVREVHARSAGLIERVSRYSPGVSVAILNLNRPEYIIPLVEQLSLQAHHFRSQGVGFEIIIGDTGSTDADVLDFYKRCEARVQRSMKYHFSRCNNELAKRSSPFDTLLFCNNDVLFPPASLAVWDLYACLRNEPTTGIVGPIMWFADQTIQHAGIEFLKNPRMRGLSYHAGARERLRPGEKSYPKICPAVTGACLAIRRDLFVRVGGMDEGYEKECQDVALCLSAHRLGYAAKVLDCGHVIHFENGTRPKGEEDWVDRQRFLRKWGSYIEAMFLCDA